MTEEIIIDVQFDEGDLNNRLNQIGKSMQELTNENKKLKKELKTNPQLYAENAAKIFQNAEALDELKVQQKVIQGNIKTLAVDNDILTKSLYEQEDALQDLREQYASLNAEQKKSEGGQEILKRLKELDVQVGITRREMGQFQIDVGKYPQAFAPAINTLNDVLTSMQALTTGSQTFGTVFKSTMTGVTTSLKSFGKMLITPPIGIIVAILTAIVVVFQLVSKAISKSEEATKSLSLVMASLEPILNLVGKALQAIGKIVAVVLTGIVNFLAKISPAIKAAQDLKKVENDLIESQTRYAETVSKNSLTIARDRQRAADAEKYSFEERKKYLKEAFDLEAENLKQAQKNAGLELEISLKKAKQENDSSKETRENIAKLRQAYTDSVLAADQAYLTFSKDVKALENEIKSNAQKAQETARQNFETQRKYSEQLEDLIIYTLKSTSEIEIETTRITGQRRINELERTLNEEKGLTKQAREDIRKIIITTEELTNAKIAELRKKASEDELKEETQRQIDLINVKLEAVAKGSYEERYLRLNQIDLLEQEELKRYEVSSEMYLAVIRKYAKQREDVETQTELTIQQNRAQFAENELQRALMAAQTEEDRARIQFENERLKLENLINLDTEQKMRLYANQEAYEAAVIASQQRMAESENMLSAARIKSIEDQVTATQTLSSSWEEVMSAIAGDSSDMLIFQKAIALANVSLELAKAIASATAASTQGDPYTMAVRIAVNVASVIAAFASVTKAINSTKTPKSPKFATGGIVQGASYSGDTINARVNSGEMILTRTQQAQLFDIANNRVSSSNIIDYDKMAEAFKAGAGSLPAPKMVYSEFENFENELLTLTENTTL